LIRQLGHRRRTTSNQYEFFDESRAFGRRRHCLNFVPPLFLLFEEVFQPRGAKAAGDSAGFGRIESFLWKHDIAALVINRKPRQAATLEGIQTNQFGMVSQSESSVQPTAYECVSHEGNPQFLPVILILLPENP
jgi:hypothetical protein